jgi:RNA polymerase sigma-70 factor (ECF subfamily)
MRDLEPVIPSHLKIAEPEKPDESGVKGRARLIDWFGRWRRPMRNWIASNADVPSCEVDDLTQEVFLRLLRYSDDVLVENPQGYLFRVATNYILEWRQRCRVRMPHDAEWLDELLIEEGEEPENALARAWEHQCVRAEVDRLPARQREILVLHVVEGMTYRQIAQVRGITHRIVLRDLSRAYATLRSRLFLQDM